MADITRYVARQIRRLREERGLSVREMASRVGLASHARWVGIEDEGYGPKKLETLQRCAEALGVPMSEILAYAELEMERDAGEDRHG